MNWRCGRRLWGTLVVLTFAGCASSLANPPASDLRPTPTPPAAADAGPPPADEAQVQRTAALIAQLQSETPAQREAAAAQLGLFPGPEVRRALEERLAHEEDGRVREALQRSLTKTEP